MGVRPLKKTQASVTHAYSAFDQLDGSHPWMTAVPTGYVPYRVRELQSGEVAYFNFVLAKEMDLIPQDHPHQMTPQLREKLIETFSIRIINEYDEVTGKKYDDKTIKPNKYMASRYLQLQHPNKQGKTSGDGRGIWNGIVSNRGKIWDVSSRGTGVTCLAPGAVAANRPLKTGAGDFGYGCGQADIDELYGAAILAEIMHVQGIHTERILCIIDLGKGVGIGVRAAPNLLRPAHMFMYLKQNRLADLRAAVDYFMSRQVQNGNFKPKAKGLGKYDELVESISRDFAEFTAKLDIDYVFAWLDWDGDNVLANAGIIDYGSVRQFGLRHDLYRYDDIERFSTNLNEQRLKAREMVQVFAQIADYLKSEKKKPFDEFAKHPSVINFNKYFAEARAHRLLYRMGFNEIQRQNILKEPGLFDQFDKEFSYFERAKISGTMQKVADGVNHPALFNIRVALRELPQYFVTHGIQDVTMPEELLFKLMLSAFSKLKDTKMRPKHHGHIQNFQRLYKQLLYAAAGKQKPVQILPGILERALKLNREDRITGNALIQIVFELMDQRKKGTSHIEIQKVIDQLIYSHLDMPEVKISRHFLQQPHLVVREDLYSKILSLVAEHAEDI